MMYRVEQKQTQLEHRLAEIVKAEIERQGHTQSSVAMLAHISDKHMSGIMNGKATASFEVWQRIFDQLGITL